MTPKQEVTGPLPGSWTSGPKTRGPVGILETYSKPGCTLVQPRENTECIKKI